MNIFVLDKNPLIAASNLCDKHVVKMALESCQLLCSVFDEAPYKKTHYNHPASIWTRTSFQNFKWLLQHTHGIFEEYTQRYNKRHKSQDVYEWVNDNFYDLKFDLFEQTPFVKCMPDEYKVDCPIESYRNYYRGDKRSFAKWKLGNIPEWFDKK